LGGVKVGTRLSIDGSGVLSADVQTTDITGKASLALDNLASVAINTSLISDTDSTDNLGSSAKYWATTYTDNIVSGGNTAITVPNSGNVNAVDIIQNDTTNNKKGISITNAGTGNSLSIDANGNASSSQSSGGALLIDCTWK